MSPCKNGRCYSAAAAVYCYYLQEAACRKLFIRIFMPKVSVIIATHSRPNLLPRAVQSAFAAGTDVEVIVVDDASTDETAEVCRSLNGVKYVRVERNQRVAGARNIGILASAGDYISFHDDDDLRIPGSLDKQVAILEENPEVAFVYGKGVEGDENCLPKENTASPAECAQGDIFWDILSYDFITCGSVVFRKECIYKIGFLEKDLHRIDDWDLWIRLAECYPVKALEEPVYIWRGSDPQSGQGTSNLADIFLTAYRAYKKRWLELPRARQGSAEQRKKVLKKATHWMSSMLIWEGIEAVKKKNPSVTLRNFRAAARITPKLFFHPTTIFNIVRHSLFPT